MIPKGGGGFGEGDTWNCKFWHTKGAPGIFRSTAIFLGVVSSVVSIRSLIVPTNLLCRAPLACEGLLLRVFRSLAYITFASRGCMGCQEITVANQRPTGNQKQHSRSILVIVP